MKHVLESTSDLSNGAKLELSTFERDNQTEVLLNLQGIEKESLRLVNSFMSISKKDLHEFIGILLHIQSKIKNK